MPIASRNAKTLGNVTFAAEVAAGQRKAKSVEVDADLDTLYDIINRLDAANLIDLAITTLKLADGAVTAAKIAAGTITTAQIAAAAGILGTQLANLTIPLGKIASQATISARRQGHVNVPAAFGVGVNVLHTEDITPRGSLVECQIGASGMVGVAADGAPRTVTVYLYRGATPLASQAVKVAQPAGNTGTFQFPWSIAFPFSDGGATPGVVNSYSVRGECAAGASAEATTCFVHLLEHA